jgi:TfoX/Sxy family transcriptional regulator of competence genes
MPYNETLADRVRNGLREREDVSERKMFGGIGFMVGDHMCCGVIGDDLLVRLGAERADSALEEPHVRPMDFTGRPSRGFVFVAPDGTAEAKDLERWIGRALDFVATLPPKG